MSLLKFISEQGYKADSPDKNNPYNIIPSGNITMQNVPHPVFGIDNLGNAQMMYPGGEYNYGGDYVMEIPIAQAGMQADSLSNYVTAAKAWEKRKDPAEPSYKELLNQFRNKSHVNKDFVSDPYTGDKSDEIGRVGYYDTMVNDKGSWIPVSVPLHEKPKGTQKRPRSTIEKVEPKSLQVQDTMPSINTTFREGVPELPEPTITGYTQSWNPDLRKWEQEPVYTTIAEPGMYTYGGDIQTGGGYNYNEINSLQEGGSIHIKPSKRGTFTAAAKQRGMGVQEFASKVMANKDQYSPAMVKKANFARNASKWKKQEGGYIDAELTDDQIADLRAQGFVVEEIAQDGVQYNTPEYRKAYEQGTVTRYNPETDVYQAPNLPEFTVKPRSFMDEMDQIGHTAMKFLAEMTPFPAALRIIDTPMEHLKGTGQTLADIMVYATPGAKMLGDIDYYLRGTDPNVNPFTGQPYWEGVDQALDVAAVVPELGAGVKALGLGRRAKNIFKPIKISSNIVPDVQTASLDDIITEPLTMFTKNELNPGKHLYRKIGNRKGLQSLIDEGGAQAPAPMRMNSGFTVDTPFFGIGNKPNENYKGIFAVEHPVPSKSKYNWDSWVGGTSNYGVAPYNDKGLVKNIPLDELDVYRKKWFSKNYKKLDKDNLEAGLKYADEQALAEKAWKWGIRGAIAHDVMSDDENRFITKAQNLIQKEQEGEYIDMELTDQEIAQMRAQGYRVDVL